MRTVTGLLICRLLALDVVFVDKVLQMDKTGHVPQRLHALAGFGLRVFPATVSIRFHMVGVGYIYMTANCSLLFSKFVFQEQLCLPSEFLNYLSSLIS